MTQSPVWPLRWEFAPAEDDIRSCFWWYLLEIIGNQSPTHTALTESKGIGESFVCVRACVSVCLRKWPQFRASSRLTTELFRLLGSDPFLIFCLPCGSALSQSSILSPGFCTGTHGDSFLQIPGFIRIELSYHTGLWTSLRQLPSLWVIKISYERIQKIPK